MRILRSATLAGADRGSRGASRSRVLRRGALLACFALFAAACGGDDSEDASSDTVAPQTDGSAEPDSTPSGGVVSRDELVRLAQEEGGSITWYTSQGDGTNIALAEAFEDEFGIQVEIVKLNTAPMLERFQTELQAGVNAADVLEPSSPTPSETNPEWFAPLTDLPAWEAFPEDYKTDNAFVSLISPFSINYNTDLVDPDEVPQSWQDLTDPKWRGRVLFTDPRTTPTWMGWAWRMQETQGMEYLEKISELDLALADSATAAAAQIAAGAYALSFPASPGNLSEVKNQGAPVDLVIITEDTSGPAQYVGVVANAPNPHAARLFVDWRMTAPSMNVVCREVGGGVASPLPDASDCDSELLGGWEPINYEIFGDREATDPILDALGIG